MEGLQLWLYGVWPQVQALRPRQCLVRGGADRAAGSPARGDGAQKRA